MFGEVNFGLIAVYILSLLIAVVAMVSFVSSLVKEADLSKARRARAVMHWTRLK